MTAPLFPPGKMMAAPSGGVAVDRLQEFYSKVTCVTARFLDSKVWRITAATEARCRWAACEPASSDG
jgi:hypothetical protein